MDSNDDYESSVGDIEDLDDLNESEPLTFELYEQRNAVPIQETGSLKSSFRNSEDGSVIYSDRKSDYSATAQRLVWVDGYEATPSQQGKERQDMTLVVLKMTFTSLDPGTRFKHVKITLKLKDANKKGLEDPEVQAWAPFRHKEEWNPTTNQRELSKSRDLNVTAGYSGSEISVGGTLEKKISWEQTDFENGQSSYETNDDGKINGVTWFLAQNNLQDRGVKQEFWASVLFSRSSRAPYKATFDVDACVGNFHNLSHKTRRFFGIPSGQKQVFNITPWKKQVYNYEGKDIKDHIDIENLGDLREKGFRTKLSVSWGPKSATTPPPESSNSKAGKAGMQLETSSTDHDDKDEPIKNLGFSPKQVDGDVAKSRWLGEPDHAALPEETTTTPLPQDPAQIRGNKYSRQPDSSLPMGYYHPGIVCDNVRLAALEGRVAQTEARIATQEAIIFQLRQTLLENDSKILKLERSLLSFTGADHI